MFGSSSCFCYGEHAVGWFKAVELLKLFFAFQHSVSDTIFTEN